ncbi:MAG TPA: Na+/H+ antiporter [Candidatus Sulfotelmatobacter sp.]|nr:Na+/H+ antiporter [Candidatus Sulfotelmatobacter sp.]
MKPITTNSAVEFLVVLLIAASVIAIVAKRFRFPYTVALVVGGLILGWLRLPHLSPLVPGQRPDWLTPDVILFLFLPALVFEGSLKLQLRELQRDSASLMLLANLGVLVAAFVVGYLVHWSTGLPVSVALLFGAIISATDPISVIAIFRDLRMERRLSVIIEGESLLNDGTAAALFQILLAGVIAGHLALTTGILQFILAVLGGAILGIVLGYVASRITGKINDPELEITLTTVVAYASYLLAYQLHLSGIIATAAAGLIIGNLGAKNCMTPESRSAVESFWAYVAFAMNSLVFLLIGLEVHIDALVRSWRPVLFAIGAVLLGRAISVYLLVPASNLLGEKIPGRWQHVIVWGGLRGALALALALSLDNNFPERSRILDLTFGVVVFSILVQGLTIKPLLRFLNLANGQR